MCYFVEMDLCPHKYNEITVMFKINGIVILNIVQNDVFLL